MLKLVFASVLFLVTHLGIASTSLRTTLVARIGRNGYLGVYSLIAAATLAYLIVSYAAHPISPYLWVAPSGVRVAVYILVAVAFVLLIGGFVTRNPTALGQEKTMAQPPRGVVCITRHPFQWSVVLWSLAHVMANGDLASVVFFGTFGVLSVAGTVLIDRRKSDEPGWPGFAAATSNIPFGAVLGGRARLALRELLVPIAAGLGVYAVVFWGHRWIAGVGLI